jgi:hypothetical protein
MSPSFRHVLSRSTQDTSAVFKYCIILKQKCSIFSINAQHCRRCRVVSEKSNAEKEGSIFCYCSLVNFQANPENKTFMGAEKNLRAEALA